MAFCTTCGAQIDDRAAFCTSCGNPTGGKTQPAAAPAPGAPSAPVQATRPATGGGGGALKIVLVVLAIMIGLGIVMSIVVGLVGYRIMKKTRVETDGNNATVTTPFGSVKTSADASQVAEELGVEVYPGARSRKEAAVVNFGGMKVVSAEFDTDDPPERVGAFYREQFPKAMINSREGGHQSIVVNNNKGMITIDVEPEGSGSRIKISNVAGKRPMNVPPDTQGSPDTSQQN